MTAHQSSSSISTGGSGTKSFDSFMDHLRKDDRREAEPLSPEGAVASFPPGAADPVGDDPAEAAWLTGQPGGWTARHQLLHLLSVLLFVVGSAIYCTMAVKDYRWALRMLTKPPSVRTPDGLPDDDAVWFDHKAGGLANVALWAPEGGRRELGERHRRLLGAGSPRRPLTTAAASSRRSNLRRLQTPEEQWYDECWTDLPASIQAAYEELGYTEELWDEGGDVESDDYDWAELSEVQLAAALEIGELFRCSLGGCHAGSDATHRPPPLY